MTDSTIAARREQLVAEMGEQMRTMKDEDIAARGVGMLIECEGVINRWQETLELLFEAHSVARRKPSDQDWPNPLAHMEQDGGEKN